MTQVYQFVDDNGVTRLFAEIVPDPAGTPFNGGTITGALTIADTVAADVPLTINGVAALAADLVDISNNAGSGVFIAPTGAVQIAPDTNNVGLIVSLTNAASDIVQIQTALGATLAAIKYTGALSTRAAIPSDASLAAGEVSLWFDATNGASKLMVKGKSADGTVVTGSVTLT